MVVNKFVLSNHSQNQSATLSGSGMSEQYNRKKRKQKFNMQLRQQINEDEYLSSIGNNMVDQKYSDLSPIVTSENDLEMSENEKRLLMQ